MPSAQKSRPKYYDLNLLNLPLPGMVSILHRMTGVTMLMFLIPVALFLLQSTLHSESGFNFWRNVLNFPIVKLAVLGLVWAYMHHLFAGIRYLVMDVHLAVTKESARLTAIAVLVMGLLATALVGVRIW